MSAAFFLRQVFGLGQIGKHRRVLKVAPGFIDHHQLHPGGLIRVLQSQPQPFEKIKECRFAQVFVLGRARQVDHLPVLEVEIVPIGRVVKVPGPRPVSVPAPQSGPHLRGKRTDQRPQGPAPGCKGVEVFDAGANLAGVFAAWRPPADPQQARDPAGEELESRSPSGSEKGRKRKPALPLPSGESSIVPPPRTV